MLRAVPPDSWLDVGSILPYPAADEGVVDMCTGSADLGCRGYGVEHGTWITGGRRRKPGPLHDAKGGPMSLQLNHVHLKTRDPEKTAKFYVDTLGAKIVRQAGKWLSPGPAWAIAQRDEFLEAQTREQKYGMEHIAIDTDELDSVVEKLTLRGSTFWSRPDLRRTAGMLLRGTGWRAARVHRDEVARVAHFTAQT